MQAGETSDGWTDAESLLLLDGVQMYGERWNGVASHVGTKNAVQCIIHFLQLPEEDPYLDALERPDLSTGCSLPMGDSPNSSHGALSRQTQT